MNIALIGYGKMGKTIEQFSKERGHNISKIIDIDNRSELKDISNDEIDVAIEFTNPNVSFQNIITCIDLKIPIISGTTGWLDHYDEVVKICNEKKGTFLWASNFSLGVNIFFKLNEWLSRVIGNYNSYKVSLEEIHHTEKLDRPSGTAITLANSIIAQNNKYKNWALKDKNVLKDNEVPITSVREPEIPGKHSVSYTSVIDQIDIVHTAKNRDGFALGAVLVAEWILDKKGVLTMNDFMKI